MKTLLQGYMESVFTISWTTFLQAHTPTTQDTILGVCWVPHVCIYCFCILNPRQEKAFRCYKSHLIWGKYTIQRLEGWDTQVLMAHFTSQHFLSCRTVKVTDEPQKINNQHPSLRCDHCILIKQVTLTFQALHIIFITALLPMAGKPQNYRMSTMNLKH